MFWICWNWGIGIFMQGSRVTETEGHIDKRSSGDSVLSDRMLPTPVSMEALRRRMRLSFLMAFFLFLGLFGETYSIVTSYIRAEDRWESYSRGELLLVRLVSDIKDAETGQRGFVITGEQSYLAPYRKALGNIRRDMKAIRMLREMVPSLSGIAVLMSSLVQKKMGELTVTVRLRKEAGFNAAREMVLTDYGKKLMDQIRAISIQMRGLIVQKKIHERQVLRRRQEKIFLAGSVLALTIVSFWAILYRLIGKEIHAREDLMRRLREESTHDFLTGLFNRPAALEILVHAIGNAQRKKWMVGVLMVDLDGFKGINDRWGHLEGDRVLVEVARRFQGVMREGEVLARLGGDEFLCLMPVLEESGGAFLLAKRFLKVFQKPFGGSGGDGRLGCSIGVSVYPADGLDAKELLAAADRRMYVAKGRGGQNICCE